MNVACPLLAQSGHIELHCTCPLLTKADICGDVLLYHYGCTDRYPVIEICDVLVPHPETAG